MNIEIPDVLAISSSACFCPEEDDEENFDGSTVTWTFELLKSCRLGPGLYRIEFIRNLSSEERTQKSATLLAEAIEAQRAETSSGSVEDESGVLEEDAPQQYGKGGRG